jgi:alpha-methylacyl-CoA racemase
MVENADVIIDPFRPGVCENSASARGLPGAQSAAGVCAHDRLGAGGPLAQAAGHDINYIALTGALFANGERDGRPLPPLNLVGDMGGGGMLLVNGVLAALLETANSGQGQVIDVAMVDGAAQLMWMFHSFTRMGVWNADQREANLLDGGAHFYNCYECADGEYVALGSIEPQFYALLMEKAGLSG